MRSPEESEFLRTKVFRGRALFIEELANEQISMHSEVKPDGYTKDEHGVKWAKYKPTGRLRAFIYGHRVPMWVALAACRYLHPGERFGDDRPPVDELGEEQRTMTEQRTVSLLCRKHPRYAGLRKPRARCVQCQRIYRAAERGRRKLPIDRGGLGKFD